MEEPDETFIVRVDSTKGGHYWFRDRRLVSEKAEGKRELLRCEAIQRAHWMFSDLTHRLKSTRSLDEISTMKTDYGDRLEIELPTLESRRLAAMPGRRIHRSALLPALFRLP